MSGRGIWPLADGRLQNQRALKAKLKGATLGDSSKDDSLDTAAWLKKQKKRAKQREKELAERRAREMEEADRAAAYDERDLEGLKVGHGAEAFESGEDVILTLKDSRVLGEDGKSLNARAEHRADFAEDELQNVNLVDDEKVRAAKERKRKALEQYTGYDDDEFDESRIGRKADILGKYDDEFLTGNVKTEGFRLGAAIEKKPEAEEDSEMIALGHEPANKVKLDLNFAKDFEVSDYMKEGDAGFKQRKVSSKERTMFGADGVQKKKSKRSTRKAEGDDDDMAVDGEPTFEKRVVEDGPQNLVDDDDLQAALARQRRLNTKKAPKVKSEDLVAQLASRRQEEDSTAPQDDGDEDGRITFDDTSEFVRNVTLESRAAPVKRERAASPVAGPSQQPVVVKIEAEAADNVNALVNGDEDEEMDSDDEDEALAEIAAREGLSIQEYRIKIDAQMQEMEKVKAEGAEASQAWIATMQADVQAAATESEPVVGSGMAGVLNLLRQQGALQKRSDEDAERERIQKQRDLWLADYRRRQAQRELERIQARGGNKDQAQREWENRMREQQEAKDALELYQNYKPDINIVYHDEFGRGKLSAHDPLGELMRRNDTQGSMEVALAQVPVRVADLSEDKLTRSGKSSGRMKTEKRLKKIAEERKQLQMSAGDTPLGMTDAFARRQQKTGQAHMVLSVGNKGYVWAE